MGRTRVSTLYCPHCQYNLTGLPENRCPECGHPFDPARLAFGPGEIYVPEPIVGRLEFMRRAHFGRILAVQAVVAMAFSIVLDGGRLLYLFSIVMLMYWGAVLFSVARRETFAQAELTLNWVGCLLPVLVIALAFL
ncbi:MAG: hypothetical protein AMXMBFR13_14580 [Phycisphaerae bacterium]